MHDKSCFDAFWLSMNTTMIARNGEKAYAQEKLSI